MSLPRNRPACAAPRHLSFAKVASRVALVLGLGFPAVTQAATNTFVNPIATAGADPWMIQWQGNYYYCQSRRGSVWVHKSARLTDIGKSRGAQVWTPPRRTAYSRELWAPELHYLRGKWFIYVAADDGDNANHRMFVLEGTSQDPQAPFVFRGMLATPTNRWAIDGTVLQMPGEKLYFLWSGWDGTENVAQNLYLAPMSDPLTISGERVCISRPEHDWEREGRPLVNEGPEVLRNGDKLFIIYSASASWADHYCLGQLTWTGTGGDVLDPKSWVKQPTSAFSGTDKVISPGHASFVKSRDGKEDWIVYHTAKHPGAGWDRQVQAQRFTWGSDGAPDFSEPVAVGLPLPVPSGD